MCGGPRGHCVAPLRFRGGPRTAPSPPSPKRSTLKPQAPSRLVEACRCSTWPIRRLPQRRLLYPKLKRPAVPAINPVGNDAKGCQLTYSCLRMLLTDSALVTRRASKYPLTPALDCGAFAVLGMSSLAKKLLGGCHWWSSCTCVRSLILTFHNSP